MLVFWGLLSLKFTSGPVCLEEFGNLLLCQATYLGYLVAARFGGQGIFCEGRFFSSAFPLLKKASRMKEKDAKKKTSWRKKSSKIPKLNRNLFGIKAQNGNWNRCFVKPNNSFFLLVTMVFKSWPAALLLRVVHQRTRGHLQMVLRFILPKKNDECPQNRNHFQQEISSSNHWCSEVSVFFGE